NVSRSLDEQLGTLVATMNRADAENDVKSYLHANRDFHFTIYRTAASDTLLSIIESLWLQISPYFNLLHASGDYQRANREHGAIAAALADGNGKSARAAVVADINGAARTPRKILTATAH